MWRSKIVPPALALMFVACSSFWKPAVKTVLDVALVECISKNPMIPEDVLKKVCPWDEALTPLVEQLLAAQKEGTQKVQAKVSAETKAACAPAH